MTAATESQQAQQAQDLARRILEAVATDQRVPMPSLHTPETAFLRARSASRAMDWTLAAMPAHQIENVGRYLRSMLEQEPLRSDPLYEPQRVVLGLLLLVLRDIWRDSSRAEAVA